MAFGAALATIGLAACDAATPPGAADSRTTEFESIASDESISQVVRDRDAYARARRLAALLPTLGPEAVPEAKETLGNWALDLGGTEIELLVRFWASQHPEEATRWAVDQSPYVYRSSAVMSSLPLWAEVDPLAAVVPTQEWMQRPDVGATALVALVRGWLASDHPGLEQYIYDLGVGSWRQRALGAYLRALMQSEGGDAVTGWAESLPDDDVPYKQAAYRQVAATLPLFDRDAGLRWCAEQCDGPYGEGLRNMIARRWVRSDGQATLEWLETAPDGYDRDGAVGAAFDLWARTDHEAALGWLTAQADQDSGAWLQPAFQSAAQLVAVESPPDAIAWAERIESEKQRQGVLMFIARKWRQQDEAAAEAWLLQSSLSEEAREKVRAPR